MSALYNDNDAHCAQWLRNLVAAGLVSPGEVDARDIRDVQPGDLAGFKRCHFFSGIALWDHALDLAGWTGPVWTGSCPCQPFSTAGRQRAHLDKRHLWPAFYRLIAECRPPAIFGEQIAGKLGGTWVAAVRHDLEGLGYRVGIAGLPACGVGALHIRQRLYWVAIANERQRGRLADGEGRFAHGTAAGWLEGDSQPQSHSHAGGVAIADSEGRGLIGGELSSHCDAPSGGDADRSGPAGGLGDASNDRLQGTERSQLHGDPTGPLQPAGRSDRAADPWADLEWIACRDGRWRPAQSGIFPLAARHPGDVAKLRAYGNSIVPQVAAVFIRAVMDCLK